jgi:ribonuclease E
VHTLEAAKALLAAQAASAPSQTEEAYDDEEPFDIEAEIETEETEGLTDEAAAGEEAGTEAEGDGHRRKRRRRRRGRGGEVREGGLPREDGEAVRTAPEAAEGAVAEEGEADEDEANEQPNLARNDQGPNDERRPRRRGRRGGRRRRGGGPEDGLAGSIADELGPTSVPEATDAVADFDGGSTDPAPTLVQPEPFAYQPQFEPVEQRAQPAAVSEPAAEETAQEAERAAARRRSTVREKVSFVTSSAPPEAAPPIVHNQPEEMPAPPAEPAPSATTETVPTTETAPRKAGWWSRRFGGG